MQSWLRQVTATDPHPPWSYHASAAAKYETGFYKAFGIRKGDHCVLHGQRVAVAIA